MSRSNNTNRARQKRDIRRSFRDIWNLETDLLSRIRKEDDALPVALNRHGNNRKWIAAEKVRLRRKVRHDLNRESYTECL